MKPENALNPLECLIQNYHAASMPPHLFTEILQMAQLAKVIWTWAIINQYTYLKCGPSFKLYYVCVCVHLFLHMFIICTYHENVFKNMLYCVKDVQARFLEGTQPFRYENPLKSPAWHAFPAWLACPSNCPARLSWHSMLHGATPPDFRNEGRQLSETWRAAMKRSEKGGATLRTPWKFNSEFNSWKPWWLEY